MGQWINSMDRTELSGKLSEPQRSVCRADQVLQRNDTCEVSDGRLTFVPSDGFSKSSHLTPRLGLPNNFRIAWSQVLQDSGVLEPPKCKIVCVGAHFWVYFVKNYIIISYSAPEM